MRQSLKVSIVGSASCIRVSMDIPFFNKMGVYVRLKNCRCVVALLSINEVKATCQINSKIEQQQQMPKKSHEMNMHPTLCMWIHI